MSLIDTAKAHPLATGGIALVGVIVVLLVLNSGGSATTSTTDSSADDAAAAQADQINAAAAASSQQTSAALQANSDNDATQIALAQIAAQQGTGAQAVQIATINASQQVTDLQSTLAARVTDAQTAAAVQENASNNATTVATTGLYTNAIIEAGQIASNTTLGVAQIQSEPHSLLGEIFG